VYSGSVPKSREKIMRKTTIKINKMNKHAISTALATALIAGMASHSVMADDFY